MAVKMFHKTRPNILVKLKFNLFLFFNLEKNCKNKVEENN